jgi:hypothetical protein
LCLWRRRARDHRRGDWSRSAAWWDGDRCAGRWDEAGRATRQRGGDPAIGDTIGATLAALACVLALPPYRRPLSRVVVHDRLQYRNHHRVRVVDPRKSAPNLIVPVRQVASGAWLTARQQAYEQCGEPWTLYGIHRLVTTLAAASGGLGAPHCYQVWGLSGNVPANRAQRKRAWCATF